MKKQTVLAKGGVISIIPEQSHGILIIAAQIQIDNGYDDVCLDIDRDDIDRLIEALNQLK